MALPAAHIAPARTRSARDTGLRGVRRAAAASLLSGWAVLAGAQASPPWTPSAVGRHAVELLADEAGLELTTSQWPLPRAAVTRALDALPSALPDALHTARQRVRDELQQQGQARLSLTARSRADALTGFAEDPTPGSSVAIRSAALDDSAGSLQLGARFGQRANADRSGSQTRLEDSAAVLAVDGFELQLASYRAWWSPGWQSALALGHNAPPLLGVGVQRSSVARPVSPWLAWVGPWNFQMFIARTQEVSEPYGPFLIGTRVTLRPASGLELGFTRTLQWGGRGRPQSLGSLVRAITATGTNAETPNERSSDPANQMAGFDLRVRCPAGLRCAGYGQLIGEDEAQYLPSKYLGLYGASTWTEDGEHRFFVELAETGCRAAVAEDAEQGCAYRNYAFPQGYVSAGRWLGAGVGADSRLLSVGWMGAGNNVSVKLHYGRVGSRLGSYSALPADPQHAGRVVGVSLRHGLRWGMATLSPELDWTRVKTAEGPRTQARLGAQLSVALESLAQALPRASGPAR